MAQYQWAGFDRLMSGLANLADPDAGPLMEEWEDIITEDNRRGVLAGLDKDGRPMPAVTYRPVTARPRRWTHKQEQSHLAAKGHLGAAGDNLSSAQYRRLDGPPLAPRGARSRVIANLFTQHGRVGDEWFAEGAWGEVVSRDGTQFLDAHFTGARTGRNHAVKLPVRDLRGVRTWGRNKALAALRAWGRRQIQAVT